ncbi:NfeD family protein [Oricola sp.]|uniref:NfeD family protein n=1 Tax=Oricola sp. TaxID=1979950 RepID=UPI003BA8DA69
MIMTWIEQLGGWSWIIFGLALLCLEILAPGILFLWFGIAALIVGLISLAVWGPGAELWVWQVQVLGFLVLALFLAYAGRSWLARNEKESDEPLLNNRVAQLVGRTATLEEPITNGVGKMRLGDTLWRVQGPDLPAGTTVRVLGGDNERLQVESV